MIGLGLNLRRLSSQQIASIDPATQAVLDEATLQGYTLPTAPYITKLDNFIKAQKAAGTLWNDTLIMYWFAGDGDNNFKTLNLKNPTTFKGSLFGTIINTTNGLQGNGTNGYIRTGFTPSVNGGTGIFEQNNASVRCYVHDAVATTNRAFGTWNSSGGGNIFLTLANATSAHRLNAGANQNFSFGGNGYKSMSRSGSTVTTGYNETTEQTSGIASAALAAEEIGIFRNGTNYYNPVISYFALGLQITNPLTERTNIINNL